MDVGLSASNTADGDSSNEGDFNTVTEYYRQLPYPHKKAVVDTLEKLLTALKKSTAGTSSTSCTPVKVAEKRLVPLITDPKDPTRYQDVLVKSAELRAAESKAAESRKPAAYLLNKILEMLFTKEEMCNSKGVSALHPTKMEAIQDYMHTWCKTLEFEAISRAQFVVIVQNKIGNSRMKMKKAKSFKAK